MLLMAALLSLRARGLIGLEQAGGGGKRFESWREFKKKEGAKEMQNVEGERGEINEIQTGSKREARKERLVLSSS